MYQSILAWFFVDGHLDFFSVFVMTNVYKGVSVSRYIFLNIHIQIFRNISNKAVAELKYTNV